MRLDHRVNRTAHSLVVREIGHRNSVSFTGQRGQGVLQARFIPGEQRHGGAEASELLGCGQTNALGGAAHQRVLACQIERENRGIVHAVKVAQA